MSFKYKKLLTVIASSLLFVNISFAAVQDAMQIRLEKLEQTNRQLIEYMKEIKELVNLTLKIQVTGTNEGMADMAEGLKTITANLAKQGFFILHMPDGSRRIVNNDEVSKIGENKTQISKEKPLPPEEQLRLNGITDKLMAEYKKTSSPAKAENPIA